MDNQDIFVHYKLAKELKELGFDEECFAFYNHNNQLMRYMNPDKDWNSLSSQVLKNSKITIPDTYSAPTWGQAFKFFREKYNLFSYIATYWQHKWQDCSYQWHIVENREELNSTEHFITYKQARENCLKKLIEIIKEKQ